MSTSVSPYFALGIECFYLLVVIVFDIDEVMFVDESSGAVQVCARISEGFIERESDVVIALTAVEFENEATLCKYIEPS